MFAFLIGEEYVGNYEIWDCCFSSLGAEVPLPLRNAVTSLRKDLDYGKNYRYAHDDPKGAKVQTHLPKELEGRKYYRPTGSASPADADEDFSAPW